MEVEAKLNRDGIAVAEMTAAEAEKFAKELASGKDEDGSQAVIRVKVPAGAKGVSMTLPTGAMEALGKTEHTSLSISSKAGGTKLSPEAVAEAVEATDKGRLTMEIRQVLDELEKDPSAAEIIGEHPVYDVTLSGRKGPIDQLEGDAAVFVPYIPEKDENLNGLTVFSLSEQGQAAEMQESRYDKKLGGMVFHTSRFSMFAVAVRDSNHLPFTDVKENDWFWDEVGFVYGNRVMNGTTPTTFEPYKEVSRGMMVTLLWRIDGKPVVSSRLKYKDVPQGTYYTEAVRWATHVGIIHGFTPLDFGPDAAVSRQQIAAILYRYAKYKGYDIRVSGTLRVFRDEGVVSSHSRVPLNWAIGKGLMHGRANGTLDPQGTATRAHAAAILSRFVQDVANR